jgi:hypothetical protein
MYARKRPRRRAAEVNKQGWLRAFGYLWMPESAVHMQPGIAAAFA